MKTAIKKGKVKCLSFLLILLGALVFLDGILVACVSGFHLGILMTFFLGALLMAVGVFFPRLSRIDRIGFFACLILGALLISSLAIYGAKDRVAYDEDVIIVLGAGLRGEEPLPILEKRLDAAHRYALANPDALILVSGGQGENETVAESQAMKDYLVKKGIDASRIIEENASESTMENLANCKVILDGMGFGKGKIALVTSDYHILRATEVAEMVGFCEVATVSSATPVLYALPNWLREWAAMVYYELSGIF